MTLPKRRKFWVCPIYRNRPGDGTLREGQDPPLQCANVPFLKIAGVSGELAGSGERGLRVIVNCPLSIVNSLFETLDVAARGGIRNISADDFVVVHEDGGVDFLLRVGVIFNFIHITHDLFPGVGAQIIPL